MSNYEQTRAENIRRNEQFLSTLGLQDLKKANQKRKRLKQKRDSDSESSDDQGHGSHRHRASRSSAELTERRKSSRINPELRVTNDLVELVDDRTSEQPTLRISRPATYYYLTDEQLDTEDGSTRIKVTAKTLLEYISTASPEHYELVSAGEVAHCVMRLGSMSTKALANRLNMMAKSVSPKRYEKMLIFFYCLEMGNFPALAALAKEVLKDKANLSLN
jgi:hypothetical protein